ncbi:hypothetical protein MUO83_03640 [Candidatus Bathyarchaeota archaeon]|nr:hypothetical protein [Candidatus Bathyarchaeota archaeon]
MTGLGLSRLGFGLGLGSLGINGYTYPETLKVFKFDRIDGRDVKGVQISFQCRLEVFVT